MGTAAELEDGKNGSYRPMLTMSGDAGLPVDPGDAGRGPAALPAAEVAALAPPSGRKKPAACDEPPTVVVMIRSLGLGPKLEDFTLGTGAKPLAGAETTPLAEAPPSGTAELHDDFGDGGNEDGTRPRGESNLPAFPKRPESAPEPS